MPFTPKTFGDLKQSLADRHDSGTLPTDSATLSYWARLLNRAKDYCADRLKLVTSTSLTTSSGTVAIPDDFMQDVALVDSNDLTWQLIPADESDVAVGTSYWITGSQTGGFTLNTLTGYDQTFTYYYQYRPIDMSADADECPIPDPEAVVARAYASLRMAETDPLDDAQMSFQECDRRLDEVIAQRNVNQGGTTMALYPNA